MRCAWILLLGMIGWGSAVGWSVDCKRMMLEGDVNARHEWSSELGQGWVFRVVPIRPARYSGWDLVIEHQKETGYPDALLLATLPYDSLNEREIGTTYGLRAQDAIGWNPRTFRFIAHPVSFAEGQRLFLALRDGGFGRAENQRAASTADKKAMSRLLQLQQAAAAGEFRILDAHIVPGTGDAVSYAQGWALAASRTPHENEAAASGQASERGTINWMRFSIALWLPAGWAPPRDARVTRAACP